MARKATKKDRKMVKVVYFDEQAAHDYIDIVNGGHLDWSAQEGKEKIAKIIAEIDAEIGGGFKFLTWIKAAINGSANAEYDKEAKTVIGTQLSNTLLTDYIAMASTDDNISKFQDCTVFAHAESISIYKMYSPYTIIVPKDQVPIDLEKLNEALENARGYYEMQICEEHPLKSVLRFNSKAFRNNYNLSDLTKMKLKYYAVKVGTCDVSRLNMSKEFDFTTTSKPTAETVLGENTTAGIDNLIVYDVVIAGVENE